MHTFKDWIRSDIFEVICSTSVAMAENAIGTHTWNIVYGILRLIRISFQLGFNVTTSHAPNQDSDASLWIPLSIDLISLKNWATVISPSTGLGLISTSLTHELHRPSSILDCVFFHAPVFGLKMKWKAFHFSVVQSAFIMDLKESSASEEIKSVRFVLCQGWQMENQVRYLRELIGQYCPSLVSRLKFEGYVDNRLSVVVSLFVCET